MDWVEGFLSYTKDVNSPEIFRLWTGITVVAASMERRCWTQTRQGILYPNLFTMLVSSPGIGKSEAIKRGEDLLLGCAALSVTPQSMTRASLIDALRAAAKTMMLPDGTIQDFHAMALVVDELGTMIAAHDLEFLSVLNKLFDNPVAHRERRRHFNEGKEIFIQRPQISILAGSQPAFLAHLLPEEAWGMGFTSRMMLIYAGMGVDSQDTFGELAPGQGSAELESRLGMFSEKCGEFVWEPAAMEMFNAWTRGKCAPIPDHSKLAHYLTRRKLIALKLAMISTISRSGELTVGSEDVIRALDWLLGAERVMPDIFREMAGKSDTDVIMELHYFMWQTMTQRKARGQPANLAESEMYNFLRFRVPGDKVARILDIAERSLIISRDKLDMVRWIARAKHMHGVE